MNTSTPWWTSLEVIEEPVPHIPESKILAAMPEELHSQWRNFIDGQTCLAIDGRGGELEMGVYSWDFHRFISKLQRGQLLKDGPEEWD